MAEAFLTVLLENLNSLVQRRIDLLLGVDKEIHKFSSILSTISAVLEDAEQQQLTDRAIKNWLQKLSDVSFELDDVLDDCESEAFRLECDGQKLTWSKKVRSGLSCFNPRNALFRFKIANKMKEIGDRLDEIADERMKFHLREFVGERRDQGGLRERRETSSIITEPQVYGRDQDKEKIVGFLVNKAMNCKDLSICSIVGLGGMGKTTLAQLVFNDERVDNHFELKMWVCVSEDFDVKQLVKAITESATGKKCDELHMDPLQKQLQEILKRKRFLLVLDDVWNEDEDRWDKLKSVLACGSDGASVVVTTRLKKIASFMGTVPMHDLSGLSEDDSWLLFKQRAFGNEREERPNLVKIGKEIVRKCKGVPLAAKALGGLMRFRNEEHEWLSIMQSEVWNLPQAESSILPALRLSYFHLPIEQRRCFAYCAVFPKDYMIRRERLIYLWMANGLISSKGGLEAEEIGSMMCNELCWLSFFQDIERSWHGDILGFKMHDLVHDLAQFIMADECCILKIDNDIPIDLSSRLCHLTCNFSETAALGQVLDIPCAKSLRTFMVLQDSRPGQFFTDKISYPSLRAFETQFLSCRSIKSVISSSKHLRYLNLSYSRFRTLPESICSLQQLLTLNLRGCSNLEKLPKHMSRLKSLRLLSIQSCDSLLHMPPNIGRLTSLRTLSNFIVGRRTGCHLDELRNLSYLGGFLCISSLDKVVSPTDAKNANLSTKRNLKRLYLSWEGDQNESKENAEQILEALAPSSNLNVLGIRNYGAARFPTWLSSVSLHNVSFICLYDCNSCLQLPAFRKLSSLKELKICNMSLLQYVDSEPYDGNLIGFVCLKSLVLKDLPSLEGLTREGGREMFPCLSNLFVSRCPKLTLPCMPSVKWLRVSEPSEVLLKSVRNLPSLPSFSMDRDCNMTSFPNEMLQNLTSLQYLFVTGFTQLQEFPTGTTLNNLVVLEIRLCHELKCLPEGVFQNSTRLKHIKIQRCKKLKSLSESFCNLTALQSLELVDCPELEEVFQNSTHLKHIKIESCKKLKSLSESFCNLTALQSLELVDCPELEFPDGLHHLYSLQKLSMSGLDITYDVHGGYGWSSCASHKMVVLPEALQHLPALEFMSVSYFLELTALPDWLGNLVSLRELELKGCPDLAYMPASIRHLTNLRKLTIESCPELEKTCEREVGEDWHKIAHIPDVYVGPWQHRIWGKNYITNYKHQMTDYQSAWDEDTPIWR